MPGDAPRELMRHLDVHRQAGAVVEERALEKSGERVIRDDDVDGKERLGRALFPNRRLDLRHEFR